ncbi:MAG: hypothetical protein R2758_09810 [Bacteroidales bacterium]
MDISLSRTLDAVITVTDNRIDMEGQIIDPEDPERGPGGSHMKFFASLIVMSCDSELKKVKKACSTPVAGDDPLLQCPHRL